MNPEKPFTRLLADLPEALAQDDIFVNELKSHARVITLKKGDLLLRTGEVCQNAYFINKGLFVNIFMTDKGKECVTGFSSDDQYPFLSEITVSYCVSRVSRSKPCLFAIHFSRLITSVRCWSSSPNSI